MAKPKKPKAPRKRTGLVAGEYRKRSVVYVERLRGADEQTRYVTDDLMATDTYIVQTHRYQTDWSHTVELKGELHRIPGKVVDRLISQREAIIKEQRADRGREQSQRRLNKPLTIPALNPGQDSDAEMEAGMQRDLGGGQA